MNWNDGRLITLQPDEIAASSELSTSRLYVVFLRNHNGEETNPVISWQNNVRRITVSSRSYAIVFSYGVSEISVSMDEDEPGEIECVLGSVDKPTDTTGVHAAALTVDTVHELRTYSRFHAVPSGRRYTVTIAQLDPHDNLVLVRMRRQQAKVTVLNTAAHQHEPNVYSTPAARDKYDTEHGGRVVDDPVWGDGGQFVWMNANFSKNAVMRMSPD
ncbi:hypothetical protein [Actinopolyspora halophila]|uniref:hypothetical protein n=1 Tax=Actinopolyspora halophila TaxID=1850 RepID=UPI00036F646C|nr:hypothetical protein [Actinopolyspora halophila]